MTHSKRHIHRANENNNSYVRLKMLLKLRSLTRIPRRFVTALYTPIDKTAGNRAVPTEGLVSEKRLADKLKLIENVSRRKSGRQLTYKCRQGTQKIVKTKGGGSQSSSRKISGADE